MFEQKKLMDVLLFGCNFSLSAHIQHFETAAADISSCFRRHTSTRQNLLQHSLTKTGGLFIIRVLQFWHQQQIDSTWNWDICLFFANNLVKYFVFMTKFGNPIYYLNIPGFLDTSWDLECFRSKKSLLARVGLGWQTRADPVFRCPEPRQLIKKVPAQLGQYIIYTLTLSRSGYSEDWELAIIIGNILALIAAMVRRSVYWGHTHAARGAGQQECAG